VSLVWPAIRDPDNLHLVARPLAALFDLGTIYLTYRLARTLWPDARCSSDVPSSENHLTTKDTKDTKVISAFGFRIWPPKGRGDFSRACSEGIGLLAACLVGVAVLHVQLAHFYTADPLLTFLVMLTLNLAAGVARAPSPRRSVALASRWGWRWLPR